MLSEFVQRKTDLKEFYYLDHGFHEQTIFKTVAENCLNITLGIMTIKYDGVASNWYFLKQCQHLQTIAIEIGVFGHRKFTDIFNILVTMRTLKILYIHFENDLRIQEADNEIFIKSNYGRRKPELFEYVELFMDVDIDKHVLQHLRYLIATTFIIKTLNLIVSHPAMNLKCLASIARNLYGLEHLAIHRYCFLLQASMSMVWSTLNLEKIALNSQLGLNKNLTIYVSKECEAMLRTGLERFYDPKVIAIASHSKLVGKDTKEMN